MLVPEPRVAQRCALRNGFAAASNKAVKRGVTTAWCELTVTVRLGIRGNWNVGGTITHASNGFDVVAGFAELLTQALHVRINRSRCNVCRDTPNVVKQRRARLDAVHALEQCDQELELQRRELDLGALYGDAMRCAI